MNASYSLQISERSFSLVESSSGSRSVSFHVGFDYPFTIGLAVKATPIIVERLVAGGSILVVDLPDLIRAKRVPVVADGSQTTARRSARFDHPDCQ